MKLPRDLTTQLVLAMMTVAVVCVVLSIAAFEIVYFALYALGLADISSLEALHIKPVDLIIIAGSTLIGVIIASMIAVRIARRILSPLRSVEQALRRISEGDLSARALEDRQAPREAAGLIDNFNTMADRLERASGNISIWNAQIAHELRTPLTILSGRIQGVADGLFEPDAQVISSLMTQVESLKRLVEDLRVVSLGHSGHLKLEFAQVDISREMSALVDDVRPRLALAGFNVSFNGDVGEASVDAGRLRQALLALLENARVHANPGELEVRVGLTPNKVTIDVTDAGPGLPEAFISVAFDQFARAASSQEIPGTGLGLAVVKAIARAHGGDASYDWRRDKSTFFLEVPRHQDGDCNYK